MYATDGFDTTSLRQGDILAGVPFPLLEHSKTQVLGAVDGEYDFTGLPAIQPRTHEHRQDLEWVTIQVPARFCFCAVISHCCDLELREGRRPAHVVALARLRPVSPDIRGDPARFASLRANRDPRDAETPGYIDLFYLEPHERLQNQDWVVRYGDIVTLPTVDLPLLLRKKVLQLDDRTRVKFKLKLSFALGRVSEDEINAGLENPWQGEPQQA